MLRTIPAEALPIDDAHPDCPPLEEKFCQRLARSIQRDGLIHPPVVMELADGYVVLAGRKRIHAATRILGWPDVPCNVLGRMAEGRQEAMTLAENLFRASFKGPGFRRAMARWHEIHHEEHPGSGRPYGMGRPGKDGAATDAEAGPEAEAEAEEGPAPEPPPPFWKVIRETLGVSDRTAQRLARAAGTFTLDQLDVLAASNVAEATYKAIARLETPQAVGRAVNLIASGLDHEQAVRLAASSPRASDPTARPEDPAKAPKPDDQLTDDEWLARHCGDLVASMDRRGPLLRDAILYRRLEPHVRRLAKAASEALAFARHPDGNGAFFSAAYKLCKALPPSRWRPCPGCRGSGVQPDSDRRCDRCYGGSYALPLEE